MNSLFRLFSFYADPWLRWKHLQSTMLWAFDIARWSYDMKQKQQQQQQYDVLTFRFFLLEHYVFALKTNQHTHTKCASEEMRIFPHQIIVSKVRIRHTQTHTISITHPTRANSLRSGTKGLAIFLASIKCHHSMIYLDCIQCNSPQIFFFSFAQYWWYYVLSSCRYSLPLYFVCS